MLPRKLEGCGPFVVRNCTNGIYLDKCPLDSGASCITMTYSYFVRLKFNQMKTIRAYRL